MKIYNLFGKHRDGRREGGVCLFIHGNFPGIMRNDLSIFNEDIDFFVAELSFKSITILVSVIYRPHSPVYSFNDKLYFILAKISEEHKNCFIMGDFNIDLTKSISSDFLNIVSSYGVCPLIGKTTRVPANL